MTIDFRPCICVKGGHRWPRKSSSSGLVSCDPSSAMAPPYPPGWIQLIGDRALVNSFGGCPVCVLADQLLRQIDGSRGVGAVAVRADRFDEPLGDRRTAAD